MTKRITVEMAHTAYERQKLTPRAGLTMNKSTGEACPLAALWLDADPPSDTHIARLNWQDAQFGSQYVTGFMCGFDGYVRESCLAKEFEGFDDGLAVALALNPPGRLFQ